MTQYARGICCPDLSLVLDDLPGKTEFPFAGIDDGLLVENPRLECGAHQKGLEGGSGFDGIAKGTTPGTVVFEFSE